MQQQQHQQQHPHASSNHGGSTIGQSPGSVFQSRPSTAAATPRTMSFVGKPVGPSPTANAPTTSREVSPTLYHQQFQHTLHPSVSQVRVPQSYQPQPHQQQQHNLKQYRYQANPASAPNRAGTSSSFRPSTGMPQSRAKRPPGNSGSYQRPSTSTSGSYAQKSNRPPYHKNSWQKRPGTSASASNRRPGTSASTSFQNSRPGTTSAAARRSMAVPTPASSSTNHAATKNFPIPRVTSWRDKVLM